MKCRRANKRVTFRTTLKYGLGKPPLVTSYITDLSVTGVSIKTNTIYKPGTKLYMIVYVQNKSFEAEGIVTWAQKAPPRNIRFAKNGMGIAPPRNIRFAKNGMGIEFTSVDQELIDICKEKLG
jgi:Tfp pilus assembly protein PilZ